MRRPVIVFVLLVIFGALSIGFLDMETSSKTVMLKFYRLSKIFSGFTRGGYQDKYEVLKANRDSIIYERQILASPVLLSPIPLKNTVEKFPLYSIVPVRSQKSFKGASLAIIGKTVYVDNETVTINDTFGNHFVKYNDNSIDQIFKIRKYAINTVHPEKILKVFLQTTWYAEMPDEIAKKMFSPNSTQACTNVTVLLGEKKTMVKAVAEYQVCHNPSILPQPENKVDTAYCINTPPFFTSKDDYEEGKLSGGMAHVVPNILYHLHSGVDLFVVYIPAKIRQIYLRLLAPVIERYGHRFIFVDIGDKWGGIEYMPYVGKRKGENVHKGEHNYDLQNPLSEDCLNRLKGHSRFFRTIDVDEYDMIFSHLKRNKFYTYFYPKPLTLTQVNSRQKKNLTLAWKDENYKMPYITHGILKLKSQTFDCIYLNNILFLHEGMEDEQILPNTKTYFPWHITYMKGKSLCRPENIAVTRVHKPVVCFGHKCNIKRIYVPESKKKIMELGYAHIRYTWMAQNQDFVNKEKANGRVKKTSLFNEVLKLIEDELVDLYGTNVPTDLLKAIK